MRSDLGGALVEQSIRYPKIRHLLYWLAIVLPALVGLLQIVSLVAELPHIFIFQSVPRLMLWQTAASFVLCSAAIYFFTMSPSFISRPMRRKSVVGLMAILAMLIFTQAVFLTDFAAGFLSDFFGEQLIYPGVQYRVSPLVLFCFFLLGGSIHFRNLGRKRIWIVVSDLMALLGTLVSLGLGFGLLLGIEMVYHQMEYSLIGAPTVFLFFISFIGSLFLNPEEGFAKFFLGPLPGSSVARVLIPGILSMGIGLSWFRWKAQQLGYFGTEVGVIFSFLAFVLSTTLILWLSLRRLNNAETERNILQTEKQRLYELPNHLLCILDEKACFKTVNQGFTQVLGYSEEELVGHQIWEFIHPDDISKTAEVEQRGHTIVILAFENRYRCKDGTYRWLRWTGTILDGINYGAAIDVTVEKEKEAELQTALQSMQKLSFRLSHAQEEERTRISREIHDELGQSLTVLKMDLFSFKKFFPENSEPKVRLLQILNSIDQSIQSMRTIVADLRPVALDDLGLIAAVDWWLAGVERRTGIKIKVSREVPNRMIVIEKETALFRVLQEAVTNAIRHSQSETIEVNLFEANGSLSLTVRDFGKGVSSLDFGKCNSSGIIGMRERLRPFGGEIEIGNAEGNGTRVIAKMPLEERTIL